MKKLLSLALMLVLALSCLSLVACGGGEKEEATSTPEATTTPQSEGEATPPGGETVSADLWADMPIYPGAEQDDTQYDTAASSKLIQDEQTEWHTYKTGDNLGKVAAFYKSAMSEKGWHEDKWMDIEITKADWTCQQGMYNKNNRQQVAIVRITDKGKGGTFISLKKTSHK